ncbi:MAG TPA: histidinol dehydrogenase, partial [Terriglobia bacterium]|nr:histidinol dehydrogenase [Terriglobia bacterium]
GARKRRPEEIMMRIVRVRRDDSEVLREVDRLTVADASISADVVDAAAAIARDVRARGDDALVEYSAKFDGYTLVPDMVRVSADDIQRLASAADPALVEIMRKAIRNIREFHEQQRDESWEYYAGDGVRLGLRVTPLESVGVYVPGGKAAYPSSVLMNVVPAQVAGVGRIVVATPPRLFEENPSIAAALDLLRIDEIYRVGGAQAIAALAYGTQSIRRVDKIVGPGNAYVQASKRLVYGSVDIDMMAGPSEVAVIADESCDPDWIAADLLAQAEHDELAGAWMVCWSDSVAAAAVEAVETGLNTLERNAIARRAIESRGAVFVVDNEDAAVEFVNRIAPEHVEVLMAEPDRVADRIRNAGALFVGRYAPTPVGDYFAGPSHVLPTGRSARFFSPLGVPDFLKRTSVIRYSGRAIERFGEAIEGFATAEGLTGHAKAISVRRHQS